MQLRLIDSIDDIEASAWDSLSGGDYPFVRHGFLRALEASGAVSEEAGWQPRHLLGFAGEQLVLALPLYIKHHSYGEYVFDWAWADAYQRLGLEYYPKMLSAIPFTPCTGPRLRLAASVKPTEAWPQVLAFIQDSCRRQGVSGWHCLFEQAPAPDLLAGLGASQRLGCQFHWYNRHYETFDDFLASLSSRKRKNIVKERRRVMEQGFTFTRHAGDQLTEQDWRFFFDLYRLTYLKRSGHTGYLNLDFFLRLGHQLPENCVMIKAHLQGRAVAASLFIRDQHTLYGRYWGCLAEFDFLHFETCYYQGIDFVIAEQMTRFDGGAQGEHKIARGFEPVLTYSNHWLADERLAAAVADFVAREAQAVQDYAEDCRAHLPYRTPYAGQTTPEADPRRSGSH